MAIQLEKNAITMHSFLVAKLNNRKSIRKSLERSNAIA
jgi:hypothetical protein